MGPRLFTLSLAILLISTAFVYDEVTKTIVTRLRTEQAPKSEFGIVPVDGFDSHAYSGGADIIFVHGLGSNPDTTWTAQTLHNQSAPTDSKETVCWISDFLLHDLPPSIRETTRVFYYNHDTYWQRDAVQARLWGLGLNLLHRIRTNIRNTEEERERNLIFVGYSYGGLIIKQALIQARRNKDFADIVDYTKTILFLGTPHTGSEIVKWATIIARTLQPIGSNPSIIRELAYGSVPVRDLHRDFVAVTDNHVQIVNIYETRKTRIARFWFIQWDVFCVQEESATYDGPSIQNIGLAVDHFSLNKFNSKTADQYNVVFGKLLESLEQITSRSRSRYSVPLRTVPSYVERHELSSALGKRLKAGVNDSDSPSALLLYGLGGTGKTQLALKYVEEHKNNYDPILWIDAKDPEAVRSSFRRCADELGLSVDETSATEQALADSRTIQAVLRFLRDRKRSNKRWLVVVDSADDVSWGIKTVLPQAGYGSVIITSQDSQARRLLPKCEDIHVDTMGSLEARALLLQHLKWEPDSAPHHVLQLCDEIAKRLGYLALAVDLAGAYIGNEDDQEEGLAQYLVDYVTHRDDLLQLDHFRGLSETDKTVWTVWDKTLNRIQDLEPKARPDLLLAFLAHFRGEFVQDELLRLISLGLPTLKKAFSQQKEDLPEWLQAWVHLDGNRWSSFHYRTARKVLIRYSLLQRVAGEWPGVTMHSLVQWRAKKYEADRPWDLWRLILITAGCFQIVEESSKPHFRRHIVSHIPDVSELKRDVVEADEMDKSIIGSIIGRIYHDEGRWKEAEELWVQVMETSSRVLEQEHPEKLFSVANLASIYRHQGRWKEAIKLEVQMMKKKKRVLGLEHPSTLISMANLASTYRDQGRWKEAEELFVQVMETNLKVLGKEHHSTLVSMANLASMHMKQGRWKKAEELNVLVMEIFKRILQEEHPDTLNSMNMLASTYRNQGRWKKAEKLDVQVMETRKRVLGKEHPDTLISMSNLALTYRDQGRWKEAEELLVQVMETNLKVREIEHPDTLIGMANLASMYNNQGRWKEAEELFVQVIETRKRVFGMEHPSTLISMANLATTYNGQGRWTEAEELGMQILETRERVLGKEHFDTLISMGNLASTYSNQRRWKEAEELEVKVVNARTRMLGKEHPHTLLSMGNLASTYSKQGRWEEALKMEI